MNTHPQNVLLNSLWDANGKILDLIKGAVKEFKENQDQDTCYRGWNLILNTGFLISLHKFEAILVLANPIYGSKFHMEAASLSRNLWEIWATLGWLAIEDKAEKSKRIKRFVNETHIKQDQINSCFAKRSGLPNSVEQVWLQEQAKEIKDLPKELQRLPTVENRMNDIAKRDTRFENDCEVIYTTVFKQFSDSVHFSARTILEHEFLRDDSRTLDPSYSLGIQCLDASGGFFLYITELWNISFHCISEELFREWQKAWVKVQSKVRKGSLSN